VEAGFASEWQAFVLIRLGEQHLPDGVGFGRRHEKIVSPHRLCPGIILPENALADDGDAEALKAITTWSQASAPLTVMNDAAVRCPFDRGHGAASRSRSRNADVSFST
jgi:hypothetical protein